MEASGFPSPRTTCLLPPGDIYGWLELLHNSAKGPATCITPFQCLGDFSDWRTAKKKAELNRKSLAKHSDLLSSPVFLT